MNHLCSQTQTEICWNRQQLPEDACSGIK